MRRRDFKIYIAGILSSCLIMTIMLLVLSMPKDNKIEYKPLPESFAVMIFDVNAGDYVESDTLPIGNYDLNLDKSYCTNGGTIDSYNRFDGTVAYSVDGTDECVIYLDVFEFQLYQESNGYTFAWNEVEDAVSYNIYLDDTLLLNTTELSIDLYKYIVEPGTYNVKASYLNADNNEIFSEKEISYNIQKLEYVTDLNISSNGLYYNTKLSDLANTYLSQITVPSDFDSIYAFDIGKLPSSLYLEKQNKIYLDDLKFVIDNPLYCYQYLDNCVKSVYSNNVIKPFFLSSTLYQYGEKEFAYDINYSLTETEYLKHTKGDSHFYLVSSNYFGSYQSIIIQFHKAGMIPSDWLWLMIDNPCVEQNTYVYVYDERRKRFRKKKIKYIKPKDKLLVWDFDNGCFTMAEPLWIKKIQVADEYNELIFSDGSKLKTISQHRILNIESGKFTYPMTDDTPIGTTTLNSKGEKVTLISKKVVRKKVKYCNIITKYHMNLFTGDILTSCRFNNIYPIKDMKFVKDDRKLKTIKDYPGANEKYFNGLRLSEQNESIHDNCISDAKNTLDYIDNLKRLEKKNM